MQQIGSDPNNLNWSEDQSRFGFKMLQKMGWKIGEGLGKNNEGVSEHVKVMKRHDNLGLGAKKSNASNLDVKVVVFSEILRKLNNECRVTNSDTNTDDKNTGNSIDDKIETRTKRIHHYRRAIRATKKWNGNDLAAILGKKEINYSVEKNDDDDVVIVSNENTMEKKDGDITTNENEIQEKIVQMSKKELKSLRTQLKSGSVPDDVKHWNKKQLKQFRRELKRELKKRKSEEESKSNKKRKTHSPSTKKKSKK
jgi:Pin2-interacting protein X1